MANGFQAKDWRLLSIGLLIFCGLFVFSIKSGPQTVSKVREVISQSYRSQKFVFSPNYTSNDASFVQDQSYGNFRQPYQSTNQGNGNPSHCHVQLQWLRQIITQKFGVNLPSDLYDMSPLYKFKTHIFLDNPVFHNPKFYADTAGKVQYAEGQGILKYIKYEALLTGNKRTYLPEVHDADGFGRTCDFDPFKEYEFTFSTKVNGNSVQIYVTEKTKNPTKSGNNVSNYVFGVVNTARTKSACRTTDYFRNQTYLIVCPIVESSFEIAIDATYLSLSYFEFTCKKNFVWNLKKYKSEDFKQSNNPVSGVKGIDKPLKVRCSNNSGHQFGFWLKINDIFHWGKPDCHYSYQISEAQKQCMNKKSVINFGDSHTQNRVGALRDAFGLRKVAHYKTRHTIFLLDTILDVYESYKKGGWPADVLVLNAGNHDLRYLDIITYIATMSDIFQVFKNLNQLEKPPKIIWVETTPIHFNGFHGRSMTRQVTEAMNDWINHNMKLLGVEIVHAFEIAQTMTSQHRGYGCHFHHFLGRHVRAGQPVSVGGAIAMALLHTICPNK